MAPRIVADGGDPARGPSLVAVVKLLQERAQTLNELAERAMMFYARHRAEAPSCSPNT